MTTNVTVQTSASTSVLVPFTSAANAAIAQSALDANANQGASGGFLKYFSPTVGGAQTLPGVTFLGGVVDTVSAGANFGILPAKYTSFVNAGSGVAAVIGGVDTTLVSGANAKTIYINQSTDGHAYLGGGSNVLQNAFSFSKLSAVADGQAGTVLGASTLILDDTAGGTMNVTVSGGVLVALNGGGTDSILAQSGTVVVLAQAVSPTLHGVATIGAADSSSTIWVGADGGAVFINPGAGNAFVFQGDTLTEHSATLFGGTKVLGGQTLTAAAYTGRTTVLGMNGYLESGSAGGSIMTTGTTAGAATLVAGGAGDIMFVHGVNDVVNMGNQSNVVMSAHDISVGGGVNVIFGSGSGSAFGSAVGHNVFTFTGAGNYTVAGFHDANLVGSIYRDAAGSGGAGTITIADFIPQQVSTVGTVTVGSAIFDQFDLGSKTVANLSTTDLGGGFFNNVAVLSDGTTINFNNTFGTVHVQGTLIV